MKEGERKYGLDKEFVLLCSGSLSLHDHDTLRGDGAKRCTVAEHRRGRLRVLVGVVEPLSFDLL